MERTVNVTGTGTVSARPDCVELSLSIETKSKDYETAMNRSAEKIESLQAAAKKAGHDPEALKTLQFHVRSDYESVRDENGVYRQEFAGFVCSYRLKLTFDFDMGVLADTVGAIAASEAEPEIHISFTLREPERLRERLLDEACRSAREKAELLCRSSGVKLGRLLQIDYNWSQLPFASPTEFAAENRLMAKSRAAVADMVPEDIRLSETASFRWEME